MSMNIININRLGCRRLFPLLFIFIVFFSSCHDDVNIIGKDILPPGDELLLGFNQETKIKSYTVSVDSVLSDENQFSSARPHCLLGSYIDPVFGLSKASFLTQIRLSENVDDFGDNFKLDSVVLYLNLVSIYGEKRQHEGHEIFIYQLSDSLIKDSTYYADMDVSGFFDEENVLAHFNYTPSYKDTILAIPLDLSPFETILNDTNNYPISNESFHNAFMGLYLTSTTVQNMGSILSFNLLDESSKLTLYYHNYPESPFIPASAHSQFDFVINEKCARINLFDHDHALAPNPIPHIDEYNENDTLIYVQSMGGLKVKLEFPDINEILGTDNIVISKARLVIPVLENSTEMFSPPTNLNLRYITDSGSDEYLPDLYSNGVFYNEYFDGVYNTTINAYEFNIAIYVQDLINGGLPDKGIYLTPYSPTNVTTPNRVILKGGNAIDGIKVYLTYVIL